MQKLQGERIYKTRSGPSLPTGLVGRRIEVFCCGKYTSRIVPVYKITVWSGQCPSSVQHIMERVLQGIPRVICYLDDILITEKDDQEHLTNLEAVLKRLQDFGLRLK